MFFRQIPVLAILHFEIGRLCDPLRVFYRHRFIIRMGPVPLRIVESDFQSLCPERIHQFPEIVPSERGIGNFILRICGVPHMEAVVMLGDDDDIAESALPGKPGPAFGIKRGKGDLLGPAVIHFIRNTAVPALRIRKLVGATGPADIHHTHGCNAHMEKKAEFRILEPTQVFLFGKGIGFPFFRREIIIFPSLLGLIMLCLF